mgnify:FL=1
MFDFLKKNKGSKIVAPISGSLIPIEDVGDDVFSQKMMGDGFAVKPSDDVIYSPVKGKITTVFPTKHAIGITTPEGLEILVHMGLDTVDLKGAPFEVYVDADQEVDVDTKLARMDLDQVQAAGLDTTIVVVYTNMDKLKSFPTVSAKLVEHGDQVGSLTY